MLEGMQAYVVRPEEVADDFDYQAEWEEQERAAERFATTDVLLAWF